MIKQKLFNKTVNKLVTAFFEGSLVRGECHGCAVGNICGSKYWSYLFCTLADASQDGLVCFTQIDFEKKEVPYTARLMGQVAIRRSGYSKQELMKIEYAFETAETSGEFLDTLNTIESQYNGLMAVMDVLFDIHQVEETVQENTRHKFNHPELALT